MRLNSPSRLFPFRRLCSLLLLEKQERRGRGTEGVSSGERLGRSGHVTSDGRRAGPFQAVTVNLFDLSLSKSL